MKAAFFESAAELKTLRPEIRFGAVDATQNRKLTTELDIQGYPTIKLFVPSAGDEGGLKGPGKNYEGGRTKTDFLGYLKAVNLPATKSKEEL